MAAKMLMSNKPVFLKNKMPPLSFEKRQELVNRINGGQRISGPTGIAAEMGIAVKTIYRLKAKFTQADGSFEVQAAAVAKKQAFTRETLVEISQYGYKLSLS